MPRVGDPIESQWLPRRNRDNGPTNSSDPGPLYGVEVSTKSARITNNNGIGTETLGDEGIRRDYAIAANHKFALIAHDGRAVANPASLLDPDCAPRRGTLFSNWPVNVFIRVIVIHYEN